MSAFAKDDLELLTKYFDGIEPCTEHGEEQTEVCAECVRFFCRVCSPEPCPCWQERLMRQMIVPVHLLYPKKKEMREGKTYMELTLAAIGAILIVSQLCKGVWKRFSTQFTELIEQL